MNPETPIVVLPDAGPLITLAYAEALDLLFAPGWPVWIVDMVLYEVTRNETPTSMAIKTWVSNNKVRLLSTKVHDDYLASYASDGVKPKKSNLGELAIQETVKQLASKSPQSVSVLLFEDHNIARTAFIREDHGRLPWRHAEAASGSPDAARTLSATAELHARQMV